MKQIEFDNYGMILQGGDGGDAAANLGTLHIFNHTISKQNLDFFSLDISVFEVWLFNCSSDFKKDLINLESASIKNLGLYRRHPNPNFWGSRVNTMSRDQMIPLLGAMALYGMKKKAFQFILGHALRLFLFMTNITPNWSYPNVGKKLNIWEKVKFFFGWRPGYPAYEYKLPDFTLFEFWALELRAIYHPLLWLLFFPILTLLDLFTVIGSLDKVYFYGRDENNSDDRNHLNILLVGLQVCTTPSMMLAKKIYSKRPQTKVKSSSGVQSALDLYFGGLEDPPLNELARPIIKYYFK